MAAIGSLVPLCQRFDRLPDALRLPLASLSWNN
jgi:hypothetical protein